eukprot:scaffold328901_cov68-Tisochrysis_lutea.AAC.1
MGHDSRPLPDDDEEASKHDREKQYACWARGRRTTPPGRTTSRNTHNAGWRLLRENQRRVA